MFLFSSFRGRFRGGASQNGTAAPSPLQQAETPTLKERFEALRHVPPLIRMVWATSPAMTLGNVGARLLRAGFPVALLYVGKLIIDEVVLLAGGTGGDLSWLWQLVALELGLAVCSDLLGRVVILLDNLLGERFTHATSERLMAQAARLDVAYYEDAAFYDQLERARQQTTMRTVLLGQVLSQLQDLVTTVMLAAGIVAFAPGLIALLVLSLVPAFLKEMHLNGEAYVLTRRWTPQRRRLDYLRQLGASGDMAKEVKIFGLSGFLADSYRALAEELYAVNRGHAVRRAFWGGGLAVVGALGYYGAYAIIIWNTVNGRFSIGDLTFLAGSFRQLRGLMEGMLQRLTVIAERALYLSDLFEFLELEPQIAVPDRPRPLPGAIRQGFRFEDVGFRYPGADAWALRHLSFDLNVGDRLALVGENGAGKTTLVKLMTRLYDPTEGRILLDGHDLREYDPEALRQRIGVIFQDYVRYQMTAADNLAIGRIEARQDRSRIEHAAYSSLAHEVIGQLPNGFDQTLGRRFKDGVELSGGEWQKVALGRAYMRSADLLILDEPTAALDARAEREVFRRFADLTDGKMALFISHRFSTVRIADRILVIEGGTLREQGTHEELLVQGGRYAELFHLQAEGYR